LLRHGKIIKDMPSSAASGTPYISVRTTDIGGYVADLADWEGGWDRKNVNFDYFNKAVGTHTFAATIMQASFLMSHF
jgi:hypothetical protein